jgi:hypothetical protein
MEFLDREDELALLDDHLKRPGASLFVLYGRRRIGKTSLLSRALDGVPRAAYHVGTRSTVTEELGRLSRTLDEAWDVPVLRAQPLGSFEALLGLLEGVKEHSVLVLDEFPYLVESEPALPGLLQASWDRRLSRRDVKLVVCGSSIGMMEEILFSKRSPLFGRRTGQARLGPLPPHCLSAGFPWGAAEIVELAALFGGVPGYLQRLDPGLDLVGNLERHVLRRGEPLYEEIPFLLREELREPRVYHAVLATIASGARRFGEISSKVGLDRANLTRYLGVLIDLGLVEREVPVTEPQPDKSRKGLYRIADPFVSTWFSLVHPFRDALERGDAHAVLERDIVPRLERLLPGAVEPVVRELLLGPALRDEVPFPVAFAGRAWTASSEFDVVLLDEDRRRALVAEIKWTRGPVGAELLDDLHGRVRADPALGGLDCTLAVVSRSGFKGRRRAGHGERLIDISSLAW